MFSGGQRQLPECIGFLVIPDFSMIAFTAAVEPLRLANRVFGRDLYRWRGAYAGDPESASNGLWMQPLAGQIAEVADERCDVS